MLKTLQGVEGPPGLSTRKSVKSRVQKHWHREDLNAVGSDTTSSDTVTAG